MSRNQNAPREEEPREDANAQAAAPTKTEDEAKTSGADRSNDVARSDEVKETPDKPVEHEDGSNVEGAASGGVAGGVNRGDTGLQDYGDEDDDREFALGEEDDSVDDARGVVTESGYDVPWTYLTPAHFGEDLRVRTSDTDDPQRDWTAQTFAAEDDSDDEDAVAVALIPVEAEPGQTFRVDELPNVDVMRAAGIDPVQWLSGLPVRASVEDEGHRRGIPA